MSEISHKRDWTIVSSLMAAVVVAATTVAYAVINDRATVVTTLILAGSVVLFLVGAVSRLRVRVGLLGAAGSLLGLYMLVSVLFILPALAAIGALSHLLIARDRDLNRRDMVVLLAGVVIGAAVWLATLLLLMSNLNPRLRG